jgi:hypothetical protein
MIIIWIAAALCFVVLIATWVAAIVDMFKRKDMKPWQIAAWIVFIVLFPIIGVIAYVLFRPPAGEITYKDETIA